MSFAHGIVEDDRGASHGIFTHQILPSHFWNSKERTTKHKRRYR